MYFRPKELVIEIPIVQVVPIEANKLKLRGTIVTPVYVTQARKNAMEEGLVFEANLNTEEHSSHWVFIYFFLINLLDSARSLCCPQY